MQSAKVAIVTGASRGIGAATAIRLARAGYSVAVNYQGNLERANAVVREITAAGGKAKAIRADVGTESGVLDLFAAVDHEFGPVSVLVNNAAINLSNGDGTVEQVSADVIERVMAVNVTGAFLCSREAMTRMRTLGGGAIINVSSEAGKFGGNRMTPYAASKAALNTFTLGFAREAAAIGVRVNAVSPGVIDTEAHQGASAERLQNLRNSIPLGRLGSAEEVAEVIAWLASDAASYVAGAIIPVTGAR